MKSLSHYLGFKSRSPMIVNWNTAGGVAVFFVAILGVFAALQRQAAARGQFGRAPDLQNLKKLVIFGDSLSDNGNSFVKQAVPPAPYYRGRWTNGLNWVDFLPMVAGHFSAATAFFQNNGTNFAVGGSTSEILATQIDLFLQNVGGKALADNLYIIWIGTNDFSAGIAPNMTVQNIRKGIAQLSTAGAKNILVLNIPDISLTPNVIALGASTAGSARQFVSLTNMLIQLQIPLLGWLHGIKLSLVDINSIFTQVVSGPEEFRFTSSSGAAFDTATGVIIPDPGKEVFWDGFHPTTNAHRIAAGFIYETILSRYPLRETIPLAIFGPAAPGTGSV
jgi:phospholipase/lecithinase/hemolysin